MDFEYTGTGEKFETENEVQQGADNTLAEAVLKHRVLRGGKFVVDGETETTFAEYSPNIIFDGYAFIDLDGDEWNEMVVRCGTDPYFYFIAHYVRKSDTVYLYQLSSSFTPPKADGTFFINDMLYTYMQSVCRIGFDGTKLITDEKIALKNNADGIYLIDGKDVSAEMVDFYFENWQKRSNLEFIKFNAEEENKLKINVDYASDELMGNTDGYIYYADEKSSSRVVISTNQNISNFSFLAINGHEEITVSEVLYNVDFLAPDKPFIASINIYEMIADRGFSFVDEDGNTRYFVICSDGIDGPLSFQEFTPKMYNIDVNFDGHNDVLYMIGSSAGAYYFKAYVWNETDNKYIEAPSFSTMPNFVLDKESKRILSYRSSPTVVSYEMYHYDEESLDFKCTNKIYYEIPSDGNQIVLYEDKFDNGKPVNVAAYTLGTTDSRYELDKSDERIAHYFADGSFWDLDSEKWQNFALEDVIDS